MLGTGEGEALRTATVFVTLLCFFLSSCSRRRCLRLCWQCCWKAVSLTNGFTLHTVQYMTMSAVSMNAQRELEEVVYWRGKVSVEQTMRYVQVQVQWRCQIHRGRRRPSGILTDAARQPQGYLLRTARLDGSLREPIPRSGNPIEMSVLRKSLDYHEAHTGAYRA